jgi:hypothetical protein
MIGTEGAAILVLVNLIFAGVLGIAAGGLTSLVLWRPWGLKVAVVDGVLASVVAVISAYVITAIDVARGVLQSRVTLILTLAVVSVVLWHLLQRTVRSTE